MPRCDSNNVKMRHCNYAWKKTNNAPLWHMKMMLPYKNTTHLKSNLSFDFHVSWRLFKVVSSYAYKRIYTLSLLSSNKPGTSYNAWVMGVNALVMQWWTAIIWMNILSVPTHRCYNGEVQYSLAGLLTKFIGSASISIWDPTTYLD